MIRRFFTYYRPHKKLFALDLICSFIVAVCNIFYPIITKNVLRTYTGDAAEASLSFLLTWAGVLAAIYVVKSVLIYIIDYWGHSLGVRIQGDMRRQMFAKLQRLPFSYFDENKTGSIMSRLINDLFEISELAHHGPEDLFLAVITIIGAFIALCFVNPLLTVILFVCIPFIVLFAVLSRKGMLGAFRKMREEQSEINSEVESAISGMRISRAYTAEAHESEKFERSNVRYQAARCGAYREMAKFHCLMELFGDFLYFLVFLAGGLFFFYGRIDAFELTEYILFVTTLITPIKTLVSIFEQITAGASGFVRFCGVMDLADEEEAKEPVSVGRLKGEIEFQNVSFSYTASEGEQAGERVISHLDLTVHAGETLALVGPSGGGKSTLCHLIPRFYEVSEGKVTIDGIDVREMSRFDLRRNVGIVAQDVFLFAGSIRENIAYGDLNATEEQIVEAAKRAKIHDFVASLPEGYDTYVGERGVRLSGGQRQRISIARIFLKNPPILILDEATSALDNVTELSIQRSLSELSEGRTTIVVAHRLSTVRNADEIIVLTQDGVAERGSHARLMEQKGIYYDLNNAQSAIDGYRTES